MLPWRLNFYELCVFVFFLKHFHVIDIISFLFWSSSDWLDSLCVKTINPSHPVFLPRVVVVGRVESSSDHQRVGVRIELRGGIASGTSGRLGGGCGWGRRRRRNADSLASESLRTRSMARTYMGCYVGRRTNIVLSHPSRSCRFVGGVGCVWRD